MHLIKRSWIFEEKIHDYCKPTADIGSWGGILSLPNHGTKIQRNQTFDTFSEDVRDRSMNPTIKINSKYASFPSNHFWEFRTIDLWMLHLSKLSYETGNRKEKKREVWWFIHGMKQLGIKNQIVLVAMDLPSNFELFLCVFVKVNYWWWPIK